MSDSPELPIAVAINDAVTDCLANGFIPPLIVACVSPNGSTFTGRYSRDGDGFELQPLAENTEGAGFNLPMNIMLVDQRGEATRISIGPSGVIRH